jgi:hypothetical protein
VLLVHLPERQRDPDASECAKDPCESRREEVIRNEGAQSSAQQNGGQVLLNPKDHLSNSLSATRRCQAYLIS